MLAHDVVDGSRPAPLTFLLPSGEHSDHP